MVSASLWNVLLLQIFGYINIVQDSNVMWKQITKFVPEIVHEEESDMASCEETWFTEKEAKVYLWLQLKS